MKNKKISTQTNILKQNSKSKPEIIKKSNKKEFQLLYRERDSQTDENRIESIIFVKSKRIKADDKKCKSKVKDSFQRIMEDLEIHLSQHKTQKGDSKYFSKELSSTKPSQFKSTVSFKKNSKENYENLKKNKKMSQRSQSKPLKKLISPNKETLNNNNINECKSPKKKQNNFMSPNKNANNTKTSRKLKKQNSNSSQNIQFECKTLRSPKNIQQKNINKKSKRSKNKIGTFEKIKINTQLNKLEQFKKGINKIFLKVDEYLLVDNDFELIQSTRAIDRLESKLITTYRNFSKQKSRYQQNNQNQIFKKIQLNSPSKVKQSNQTFIQREEENNLSEFNINDTEDELFFNCQFHSLDQFNLLKNYSQKWWRKMTRQNKKNIQRQIQKENLLVDSCLSNQFLRIQTTPKENIKSIQNSKQNVLRSSFSSSQSFMFGCNSNNKIDLRNLQVSPSQENSLINKRKKVVEQKKQTHKIILIKFLREKKISDQVFNQKMNQIEKQYKRDYQQIYNFERILKINEDLLIQTENKINQDKQIAQNTQKYQQIIFERIFGSQSHSKGFQILKKNKENQRTSQESLLQENDTEIKKYKIGGKISSEMQDYITSRKKTQGYHQNCQNIQNYTKKTNELGEEYYEFFQSDNSSSCNSPYKSFDTDDSSDFVGDDHTRVCAFEPNTNFNQMLEEFKDQQQIKLQIEKRVSIQMGVYKQSSQIHILDTSIIGMHQFLINFFKFYLYFYKNEFLRLINMPYGYSPEKRLQFIQGYIDDNEELSEDEDGIIYGLQFIISDDVLESFLEQYYDNAFKKATDHQLKMIEYAKIHSRAIFDCFNHALNSFRPYYSINGPPYLWNSSEKALTFYFIAEQNVQQVFEKTQFKVLKWASSLIGLLVDKYESPSIQSQFSTLQSQKATLDKLLASYEVCAHPSILQNREERFTKQERSSIIQKMFEWTSFQEQKAAILYEISSLIFKQLVAEIMVQMQQIQNILQSQ